MSPESSNTSDVNKVTLSIAVLPKEVQPEVGELKGRNISKTDLKTIRESMGRGLSAMNSGIVKAANAFWEYVLKPIMYEIENANVAVANVRPDHLYKRATDKEDPIQYSNISLFDIPK